MRAFISVFFIAVAVASLMFGLNLKTVSAEESISTLYIPLIGITTVPNPAVLPKGGGTITYDYAVKNFLQEVPLTDVTVVDDTCGSVKYLEGDDNHDSKLDYAETWRYRCSTKVSVNTTSTTTVTGKANGLISTQKAYATVVVGSLAQPPLVSIINITKVAYPLALPKHGGQITFTYKVNNPGEVPLSNVIVTDDKCSDMSGQLGDTNGNKLLDPKEVWIYSCIMNLEETTTSTTKVQALANGLLATGESTLTVTVDTVNPGLPNTGIESEYKTMVWKFLIGILGLLIIVFVLTRKVKRRGKYGRK